jgi:hypothetical protein
MNDSWRVDGEHKELWGNNVIRSLGSHCSAADGLDHSLPVGTLSQAAPQILMLSPVPMNNGAHDLQDRTQHLGASDLCDPALPAGYHLIREEVATTVTNRAVGAFGANTLRTDWWWRCRPAGRQLS